MLNLKVVHVITGLNNGGAEATLFRLCTSDKDWQHVVISLSSEGKYGPMLRITGVEVHALGMRPSLPSIFAFIRLIKLLYHHRPNIVQTWMYHADLFAGIAARVSGIKAIVWGIHHSILEPGNSKLVTIWIANLLAKLSHFLPHRIAVCGQHAIQVHEAMGYDRSKMRFIPNGYDLSYFTPQVNEARVLRADWGVAPNVPLIGTVGRYDPQKDHANLFEALAHLRCRGLPLTCVLVGANMDHNNLELLGLIQNFGLEESVKLLGPRTDIPAIMSALDLHVLPSNSEAFPNVVAEAMACQTPCLVTDVGDAADIVGNTGWVVPPRDSKSLADAIEIALRDVMVSGKSGDRNRRARERVEKNYSIDRMVRGYIDIWNDTLNQR